MRPQVSHMFFANDSLNTFDPVIPNNIYAVDTDTRVAKLGDGIHTWSELPSATSTIIGSKLIQTNRDPLNHELLEFCSLEDKWVFKLRGCHLTESAIDANHESVYDHLTLIVETDDVTGLPTGRMKVCDGVTELGDIPWIGLNLYDNVPDGFPDGYGIEFNGTQFEPAKFVHYDELQAAETPTGQFHRDDGTFADISDIFVEGPPTAVDGNIPIFDGTTGKVVADSGTKLADLPGPTGSVGDTWQINVGSGPILKNSGGTLYIRNYDDSIPGHIVAGSITSDEIHTGSVIITDGVDSVELSLIDGELFANGALIWTSSNDGAGSGLDADTVDGYHSSEFPTNSDMMLYAIMMGG